MNIGIACYPTFGGSGVVATEIGLALAARGHRVHLFAYPCPARLGRLDERSGVTFHHVEVRDYPVFHQPPYTLALTSRIVDVGQRDHLDVLHVHYAVPHATSAFLARAVLGQDAPKVVTTLHGTDITLVGSDPSYRPITRFSIEQSDAVTTPSRWLADETHRLLDLAHCPIEVIPNFVDTSYFAPSTRLTNARSHIVHVSNFRPVKRVDDVVRTFAAVRREQPAHLTLIGDGPERAAIAALVDALGVAADVTFMGESDDFRAALGQADVFLLPSASESFGVAALEAQAMGVPVVASDVGGLPEVIVHGATGLLCPIGDVGALTHATLVLLRDPGRREAMGVLARRRAVEHFHMASVIDAYEALYQRLVG